MKLAAVALDYDGTLTRHGRMSRKIAEAIGRARERGVRVLLVTGRRLAHLSADAELGMFDAVVAENGAVVDFAATGRHLLLGRPAAVALLDELARRQVSFVAGECLVETEARETPQALEAIRARYEFRTWPAAELQDTGTGSPAP